MPSPRKNPKPVAAHLSSKSDNWPTPADFYAALDAEFGFVLDACASTSNHKSASYYALDHTDPNRRDGLAGDWAADAAELGGRVWMNPPYGRGIEAWMAKAYETARAGATVVTLVPVRTSSAWWHTHVLATGAEVRYVLGRLTFGDAKNTAAFGSAVVIYRPTDIPGAPGPVTTIDRHPSAPTTGATAAAPSRRQTTRTTARPAIHAVGKACGPGVDCTTCQNDTGTVFEHQFEHREWVEVADAAGTPTARTSTPEHPMSAPTTTTLAGPSRLDRLAARALASLYRTAAAALTPEACLAAARATVRRHGGMGSTYKYEAAVQHLYAAVWHYSRFFYPGPGWTLESADGDTAQLRWQHEDPAVTDLLDVVCASGHPDTAALPRPWGATVRVCHLVDRDASLLLHPGDVTPVPWQPTGAPAAAVRELVPA